MQVIKEFCKEYKEKLKVDKDIQEREVEFPDYRERINFFITKYSHRPFCIHIGEYHGTQLIRLDNEDLEYLYNKYSLKICDEMEENIQKVKDEYKDLCIK